MHVFHLRLFFRLICKNWEVYSLKIFTLAIAFACSIIIVLFSLNEFSFDRFHQQANAVVRVLQRNESETFTGNRLTISIPYNVYMRLHFHLKDSMTVSRVKALDQLSIHTEEQSFNKVLLHASDAEITEIFSFYAIDGSLNEFNNKEQTALLSASASLRYFGTLNAAGKKLKISSLEDTVMFSVAAVFKDYPLNSHEEFNVFIRFDTSAIKTLNFEPQDFSVYGRMLHGNSASIGEAINRLIKPHELTYKLQPLPEIYFGSRVDGENAKHGDNYSVLILICISGLILFLALSNFINLTTLTLPNRSKELAIKKVAGASQLNLILMFARESFMATAIALSLGILLLLFTSNLTESMLSINLTALLIKGDMVLMLILIGLFLIVAVAPLFMNLKFTRAAPNRLLSTETITFPGFKRTIALLQLGISLCLIVSSIVIKRQINYSLVKEPGRNHYQTVYMSYPEDLTDGDLYELRVNWKKSHPNIVDVMATSNLPNNIQSKEVESGFYRLRVDPGFLEFFDLKVIHGRWFQANDFDATVVNEKGKEILKETGHNAIGIIENFGGRFNQPEKPVKITIGQHFNYNFLCIRLLEVDIRKTIHYLSTYFQTETSIVLISFIDKRFEDWLQYENRLNNLSEILSIISSLISCCAIYGLSLSIARDKIKQVAIHKMLGATTVNIIVILIRGFSHQLLLATLIFAPISYIFLKEWLRNFVYSTHFTWPDPIIPLAYCIVIITITCCIQALKLNNANLTALLK